MTVIVSGHKAEDLAKLLAQNWRESGTPVIRPSGRAYRVGPVSRTRTG